MLDKISELFKEGLQYTHTAAVMQQIANLLQIFSAQNMKDESGKNACIDSICLLLQSHKDIPSDQEASNAPN